MDPKDIKELETTNKLVMESEVPSESYVPLERDLEDEDYPSRFAKCEGGCDLKIDTSKFETVYITYKYLDELQNNQKTIFSYQEIDTKFRDLGKFTSKGIIKLCSDSCKYKVENDKTYLYTISSTDNQVLKTGKFSTFYKNITTRAEIPKYTDKSDLLKIDYKFDEETGEYIYYISLEGDTLKKGEFKIYENDKLPIKTIPDYKLEQIDELEHKKSFWSKLKFWE